MARSTKYQVPAQYEKSFTTALAKEFRTGRSQGNLARTPDVVVVIPLNNFLGPAGDTVTADKHY
jgi:hypothetical protein